MGGLVELASKAARVRAVALWLMLCGAAFGDDLAPERHELEALYTKGEVQLDLTENPAAPFVTLPGNVRLYKRGGRVEAEDRSGHLPALCSLELTMTVRAMAETCRGLARPDHLRVMDTAIDSHIEFIAENHIPPRPRAEVRLFIAQKMADTYIRLKDRRLCTEREMSRWVPLVTEIDAGSFEVALADSLNADRLPVAAPCAKGS